MSWKVSVNYIGYIHQILGDSHDSVPPVQILEVACPLSHRYRNPSHNRAERNCGSLILLYLSWQFSFRHLAWLFWQWWLPPVCHGYGTACACLCSDYRQESLEQLAQKFERKVSQYGVMYCYMFHVNVFFYILGMWGLLVNLGKDGNCDTYTPLNGHPSRWTWVSHASCLTHPTMSYSGMAVNEEEWPNSTFHEG